MSGTKTNYDGLKNILSSVGGDTDVMTGYKPVGRENFSDDILMKFYRFTGLAKAVIRLPIDSCIRAGFTIKSDDKEKVKLIHDELKRINFLKNAKKAMTWNSLFGGSVIIAGVRGTGLLDEPLRPNASKGIDFLRVYRREEIVKNRKINSDPQSERYGLTEFYDILPSIGSSYAVHYTRVVELSGEDVDDTTFIENNYWGDSKMLSMYDQIVRTELTYDSIARATEDYSSFTISIKGLWDAILQDRQSEIRDRLRLFQSTRSSMNVLIHDDGEEISKITTQLSGLEQTLSAQVSGLSLVSDIPVRLLTGSQSGGLNNNGEGETGDWSETLQDLQIHVYEPIVRYIVDLIANGIGLVDYKLEMNDVGRPTLKQMAEIYDTISSSDEKYIRNKVLHPSEVRTSRFSGENTISVSTTIDSQFDDIVFEEPDETQNTEKK